MPLQPVVFDVNETLLDLSALDPLFADAFGDKSVRRVWFAQTLANSNVATILGRFEPFDAMAQAALEMTARKRGLALDEERARRIMRGLLALPAHGDAIAGLTMLRDAGFHLSVLAQAPIALLEEQLTRAKLRGFFDPLLSASDFRAFKPSLAIYDAARERLGGERPILIASHDWDIAGAMNAGWDAAYLARHGSSLNPLDPPPTFSAPDLRSLASILIERAQIAS